MADKDVTYVTKEGLAKIQEEYNHLVHVEREQVGEELKAARAQGDLSENADYDAARDRQARLEARIAELDEMLKNYELIDENVSGSKKTVRLGSTVTFQYLDDNSTDTYTIVGSVEAQPFEGKISNETPVAQALLDHKVNDICDVITSNPYKVRIIDIK